MPFLVRLLESVVSSEKCWQSGEIYECQSEEDMASMIAAKLAVPADIQPAQGVQEPEQPQPEPEQPKPAEDEFEAKKAAQPKATKSKGA
jgi:hypothetical protein